MKAKREKNHLKTKISDEWLFKYVHNNMIFLALSLSLSLSRVHSHFAGCALLSNLHQWVISFYCTTWNKGFFFCRRLFILWLIFPVSDSLWPLLPTPRHSHFKWRFHHQCEWCHLAVYWWYVLYIYFSNGMEFSSRWFWFLCFSVYVTDPDLRWIGIFFIYFISLLCVCMDFYFCIEIYAAAESLAHCKPVSCYWN